MDVRKELHHTVHTLTGLDAVFAFGHAPENESDSSPLIGGTLRTVRALLELDQAAAGAKDDPTLSDVVREGKLAPIRANLEQTIQEQKKLHDMWQAQLVAQEDALYAAPPRESSDIVGEFRDQKMRDWFDGLAPAQRTEIMAAVDRGEHRELVLALARDPVPSLGRTMGIGQWRASVEKTRPNELKALEQRRYAIEWARAAIDSAESILQRSVGASLRR
jgi:hypothetical protein